MSRYLRLFFSFLFLFAGFNSTGQTFKINICDSTILTKAEYEKCMADNVYEQDILERVKFIIALKTEVLPKFRKDRSALILGESLQKNIKALKARYDSTLMAKLNRWAADTDRNQKFIQPKAYMSTLMAMEVFKFYPDLYALLLNDIHLNLSPKTSKESLNESIKLINNLYDLIDEPLRAKLRFLTDQITIEKEAIGKQAASLFQGAIDLESRKKYAILNFLIWN